MPLFGAHNITDDLCVDGCHGRGVTITVDNSSEHGGRITATEILGDREIERLIETLQEALR